MIQLVVVNTQHRYTIIKCFKEEGQALKYVQRIFNIPPQSRECIVCHGRYTNYYEAYEFQQIMSYISAMLPSRELLMKYETYPIVHK